MNSNNLISGSRNPNRIKRTENSTLNIAGQNLEFSEIYVVGHYYR